MRNPNRCISSGDEFDWPGEEELGLEPPGARVGPGPGARVGPGPGAVHTAQVVDEAPTVEVAASEVSLTGGQGSSAEGRHACEELCSTESVFGHLAITYLHYSSLKDGARLSDPVLHLALHQVYVEYAANCGEAVHIFPSAFYSCLSGQQVSTGGEEERREREAGLTLEEVRHRRVARWTRNVTLMDKTLIIFPIFLADTEHWLLAVAVQGAEPLVMMLDSKGARRWEEAEVLAAYLEEERRVRGDQELAYWTRNIEVPRQGDHYNSGIFLIMFVENILSDPDTFIARAREDSLANWFDTSVVAGQRRRWREEVERLAGRQGRRVRPCCPSPTSGSG